MGIDNAIGMAVSASTYKTSNDNEGSSNQTDMAETKSFKA